MPRVNPRTNRWNYNAVLFATLLAVTSLVLLLRIAYFIFGLPLSYCASLALLSVVLFVALRRNSILSRAGKAVIYRIARHRSLSVALVGLIAFLLSAGLSLFVRMPQPSVHDEFSYLLASDTFAHGRLSNPTHPMWIHFESFHIIQQPTYASKYPPGQGLMLAAGQVISGYPIVGVWLSAALACAAICWMLMAWVPTRWAVLGGLMAVLHPMILAWSQNYWGGSVAMAGGALTLGAFRRLVRNPRVGDALLMGFGVAVLANSRPYEGLVLSLLLTCSLFVWMLSKKGPTLGVFLKRIVLPVSVVLALTGGAMAFYNKRVTGSAFQMPYMLHEATYAVAPPFLWQHLRPEPVYHFKEFRNFYVGYVVPVYTRHSSLAGLTLSTIGKVLALALSCFWLLIPALWLLPKRSILKRDRWMLFALVICGLFITALLPEIWVYPHYAAPAAGLVFVLSVQAMRYLRSRRYGGATGYFILRASLVLGIISFVIFCLYLSQLDHSGWNYQRAEMVTDLNRDGDRHLVIVRYKPQHDLHQEWVYNDADIDNAGVVWARDMGPAKNKELLEYFRDRRSWLLEPDAEGPRLVPYPAQLESSHSTTITDESY